MVLQASGVPNVGLKPIGVQTNGVWEENIRLSIVIPFF